MRVNFVETERIEFLMMGLENLRVEFKQQINGLNIVDLIAFWGSLSLLSLSNIRLVGLIFITDIDLGEREVNR